MKNKVQGTSLNVLIIVALGLLVLVVLAILFADELNFNPEKDVCLNVKNFSCLDTWSNDISCSGQRCFEWRSKTKCELNPEAEGCVCDEYAYCVKSVNYWGLELNFTNCPNLIYENGSAVPYNESNLYEYSCVKAHQRTLQDYNCSVLKKAVIVGTSFCNKTGKLTDRIDFFACGFGGMLEGKEELYDVAEAKGCLE